jgi:hypothetical protein
MGHLLNPDKSMGGVFGHCKKPLKTAYLWVSLSPVEPNVVANQTWDLWDQGFLP